MSENGPWTVKEDEDFIHFLVEKADNVISPLDSAQLCDEFKQRSGSTRTVENLVKRIDVIFWESHFTYFRKLMDFDTYKKVKTMFRSSAPISFFLLKEREGEKDFLERDDHNRRAVRLSQVPLNLSVYEINKKLLEFPIGISQSSTLPMNSVAFVKLFDTEATFHQQYYIDQNRIYAPLFVSQVETDSSVLKELREDAVGEAAEKNRTIEANVGSLVLKAGNHDVERKKENEELIKFIAEKCKEADSPLSINRLSTEFNEEIGSSVKAPGIGSRIRSLLPEIPKLNDFDTETKVRMLFSLSAPIDQEYLNEIRKNAKVEIDEKNRIIEYKVNDGSLVLNAENINVKRRKEDEKLLNFIAERCKRTNWPLNITQLLQEFIERIGSARKLTTLYNFIRSLLPKIPQLGGFDMETKVRMMFSLGASVYQEDLNELRKSAIVEVDEKDRIIKYTANNGSLKLSKKGYPTDDFFHDEIETCTKVPLGHKRTKSENEKLMNFIAEKSRDADSPFIINRLCTDFIETIGSSRSRKAIKARISYLRLQIPKLHNFDTQTKVRMLFSLSVSIDEEYLYGLRKNATVEVDEHHFVPADSRSSPSLFISSEYSFAFVSLFHRVFLVVHITKYPF